MRKLLATAIMTVGMLLVLIGCILGIVPTAIGSYLWEWGEDHR